MKLTVDQVTVSSGSLFCGVQIEGPEKAWLRFAMLEVPMSLISYAILQQFSEEWHKVQKAEVIQDPLF